MLEERLLVLFRDVKGAVDLVREVTTLRIVLKVASLKCVSKFCFFFIPMEGLLDKI